MDKETTINLLINLGSVIIGAILAIFLTIAWDNHKWKREVQERDKTVIIFLQEEIAENIMILVTDQQILQNDLNAISRRERVLVALTPLKNKSWDLLIQNLPSGLAKNSALLGKIRDESLYVQEVNENMRNREAYAIANGAMGNYYAVLKVYDQVVATNLNNLKSLLDDINEQVSKIQS